MIMTDEEIVRHYRQAKDQSGSIQILADLNATKKSEIRAVLERAGQIKPAEQNAGKKTQPTCTRKLDEQLARQLYEKGLIDKEVADQVGVTLGTIWNWRKKNNLPANNPGRGGGRKESKRANKIVENNTEPSQTTSFLLADPAEKPHISPVLLKIQKLLDMVSDEDSQKVCGQYLDLMITMLSDEVQRIANAK